MQITSALQTELVNIFQCFDWRLILLCKLVNSSLKIDSQSHCSFGVCSILVNSSPTMSAVFSSWISNLTFETFRKSLVLQEKEILWAIHTNESLSKYDSSQQHTSTNVSAYESAWKKAIQVDCIHTKQAYISSKQPNRDTSPSRVTILFFPKCNTVEQHVCA